MDNKKIVFGLAFSALVLIILNSSFSVGEIPTIAKGCLNNFYCTSDSACGAGQVCDNGCCKEVTCIDSDGGDKPFVAGILQFNGGQPWTDVCVNSNTLKEYYCAPLEESGVVTMQTRYWNCNTLGGFCKSGTKPGAPARCTLMINFPAIKQQIIN